MELALTFQRFLHHSGGSFARGIQTARKHLAQALVAAAFVQVQGSKGMLKQPNTNTLCVQHLKS